MDPERDLVIVSMHEKGFPQADYYQGCGDMDAIEFRCLGKSPDGFFTMKRGDTLEAAFDKARKEWPAALIVPGETDDDEVEDEE